MNLRPLFLTILLCAIPALADEVSFNRDIRPILSENCYHCHGFDEHHREANLRLDVAEGALAAIAPGRPDDSELLRRIVSRDDSEAMPPPASHKNPLNSAQVEILRRWIEQGATYETHWSFVSPVRSELARNDGSISVSAAIDVLVEQQLSQRGLEFSAPSIPTRWLRRMSLDLIGLPPTQAELSRFESEAELGGEQAYVAAVDRVLESPHFGERFALDWLDVARYADTNGFQEDAYRMNWPWRDWVVHAFNSNMPFDQFTIEQLAGDLLDAPTQDQLIATAFNRNHMINGEGGAIREENLAKTGFDRVETTGATWLGLTVGCCQCHDHKFDPLKQSDYYSFFAFFNQMDEKAGNFKQFKSHPSGLKYEKKFMVDKPFLAIASLEQQAALQELQEKSRLAREHMEAARPQFEPHFIAWVEEIREKPELAVERISNEYIRRSVNTLPLNDPTHGDTRALTDYYLKNDARWTPLMAAIDDAQRAEDALQAQVPLVMIMRDDQPNDTFILERGNYETPGDRVLASVPDFLPALPVDVKADRLALARWLVSPEHPLTSRVIVNRYWQLLFGRGLVTTPDDFGLQGALPSHPELLDWLAVEFRESGWDLKRLLKSIVLSRTYRQTSESTSERRAVDPDNTWLSRGVRQRLDARLLRDQALALSGLLNRQQGGPPVFPYQPEGIWEEMSLNKNHYEQEHGDQLYRRSLYTVWRRVVAPANFFDVANRQSCSVKLQRTSTPLHALTLLNDPTYVEAARVWAAQLSEHVDDEGRLQNAFFSATARSPNEQEVLTLQTSLEKSRQHFSKYPAEATEFVATGEAVSETEFSVAEHAAWTSICLLILNLDETLSK